MRKIFILGGSDLQLDLILEAKKMFFYTIVLDMNKDCIGSNWCDEFLEINIVNKEEVLEKAKEYKIDIILTSATELGNITACWVGEKLGLNTNTYETALNTTNKKRMKEILFQNNIKTASYNIISEEKTPDFESSAYIVKPYDSSAGRGLSYVCKKDEFSLAIKKALKYSKENEVIIEEYIEGKQYSIETITCNSFHQILAINEEFIRATPNIIEKKHLIPAVCSENIIKNIRNIVIKLLDVFNINFGACHIEVKIKDNEVYIIELASRTGGMRSEMINLAYGINYSQSLLLSSLGILSTVNPSRKDSVQCNFIIDYKSYIEYVNLKKDSFSKIFQPYEIEEVEEDFIANNLGESKGYYYILEGNINE
jgi:carbamoyl-phosphate synthase large subunit